MKKPITLGLCLVISCISFSQISNSFNTLSPSILSTSLLNFATEGKNCNAQLSVLSQLSSIPGHPVFGDIAVSFIPGGENKAKPEASLSVYAGSFGPFLNTRISGSIGIVNSLNRNKYGYRAGLKALYNNVNVDAKKLIWADPDFEPTVYEQKLAFNIGFYAGGWMNFGQSSKLATLIFSYESQGLLKEDNENSIKPYLGRYTLNYHQKLKESSYNLVYQLDLDKLGTPIHLASATYQFSIPFYAGLLATNTGFGGLSAGYIWNLNDYWDTSIDINYRYIESFGDYHSAIGSTHQFMIRCASRL